MSYDASYSLRVCSIQEIDNISINNVEIIKQFRKAYPDTKYYIKKNGEYKESGSWYEAIEQLVDFSNGHPDQLFVLSCEGEEAGDLWRAYVMNGIAQRVDAIITYPPFDLVKHNRDKATNRLPRFINHNINDR